VRYNGEKHSYFAGCDYFRLSSHPDVLQAFVEGLDRYGLNVAASRLTTGNHAIYEQLESRIAEFFEVEAATLVSNGYMANSVAAQGLAGEFSHVFIDRESHASLIDAAILLEARVIAFKRGDATDLRRRLRAAAACRRPLVITEGLFGHSGEIAPLREYLALLPRTGMLFVDDAHGAGTLGETGKGTVEELGIPSSRVIRAITLSKAFGVYGGAVLGSRKLRRRILRGSCVFLGNTPLPPPLAAAALKSLDILANDRALRRRLPAKTALVKNALRTARLPVGHPSAPIFSITPKRRQIPGLRKRLLDRGIYPSFIHYPGGPRDGYFRFAISSEHSEAQLTALIAALG
jgi:8-amino-7-oxononanoate synthase